jgi:hypothetical protein
LYDYAFQVKILEPKVHEKGSGALNNKEQIIIFVHSKHIRHQLGFDANSLFLHVHLEIIS